MSSFLSLPYSAAMNLIHLSCTYISGAIPLPGQQQPVNNHENTSAEHLVYDWLDAQLKRLQPILLWRKPLKSLVALPLLWIVLCNLINLLSRLRFYSIICGALFVHQFTIVWFRHVWPEIRVPTAAAGATEQAQLPELQSEESQSEEHLLKLSKLRPMLSNLIKISEHQLRILLEFRHLQPIGFCLTVCSMFLCTLFIGNTLSGQHIAHSLAGLILLAPGLLFSQSASALVDSLGQSINQLFSGHQDTTQQSSPTSDVHHLQDPLDGPQSDQQNVSMFDQLKQVSFLTCFNSSFNKTTIQETQQLVTNRIPTQEEQHYDEQELIEHDEEPSSHAATEKAHHDEEEDEMQEGFVIL